MEERRKRGRVLRVSYLKRVFSEEEETVAIDSAKLERKHKRKRSSADSGRGSTTNFDAPLDEQERVASQPREGAHKDREDVESVVAKREKDGEVPVHKPRFVLKKHVEIACVGVTLLVVTAMFTVPVIFYHLEQISNVTTSPTGGTQVENDSQTTGTCSVSYGVVEAGGCSTQPYSGSVCLQQLSAWQQCIMGQSEQLHITSTVDQEDAESTADMAISFVYQYSGPECYSVAEKILCYYLFPLCDTDIAVEYHATKQDCEILKDQACSNLWNIASNLYPELLPDCNSLPNEVGYNSSATTSTETPSLANITCSEDFYASNGTCLPLCGQWEQYPHSTTVAVTNVETITSVVGLMLGVISVLLSIFLFWERIMKYFFFILTTAGYCNVAILLIISAIDRVFLFCGSDSLIDSLTNPTEFCTVAGAFTHFFVINISLTWFSHVLLLSCKVILPVYFDRVHKTKLRRILLYLTLTLIVYLIPVPLVLTSLIKEDFQYATISFPPSLCIPSNINYWYYSTALPLNVLVAVGCCLCILSLWFMIKQWMQNGCSSFLVEGSDVKLLFLSFPYILFGIIVQVFTIGAANDSFMTALLAYFVCESSGMGPCNRTTFEQYTYPDMFMTLYIVLSLIPLSHFILVLLSWREIKTTIANQCITQSHLPNSPSVSNSIHPVPVDQSTPVAVTNSMHVTVDGPHDSGRGPSDSLFSKKVSRSESDYHNFIIQDKPPSPLSMKTQSSYVYSDVLF